MATINDRPLDILSRTKVIFDVRAHSYQMGVSKYARAIRTVREGDDSIRLKFEIYDQPTKEIQELWDRVPIPLLKDVSVVLAHVMSTAVDYSDKSLWQEASDELEKTIKKIKSVFVTMRFWGSCDKFIKDPVYPQLICGIARLCKNLFPDMDSDESSFIGHLGMESYHFDNMFHKYADLLDFFIASKYPNKDSRPVQLTLGSSFSNLPEEKQD